MISLKSVRAAVQLQKRDMYEGFCTSLTAVNDVQKPSNCSEFAWFYFPDRLHCSTQTHSLLNTQTNKSMTHRNDCSRNAHNNRSIFLFAPGHLLLLDSILLKAYVNDVLM